MLKAAVQPPELAVLMCERIAAVLAMKAVKIDLKWTTDFPPAQLTACCERMADSLPDTGSYCEDLQRELIQNEGFNLWLSQFRELVRAVDGEESSAPSWGVLQGSLAGLLKACWENERDITTYQAAEVYAALELERFTGSTCLTYLENFAPMNLACGAGAQLVENLAACVGLPTVLTQEQRALLVEPFVATRSLFANKGFPEIAELFGFCPELADIAWLLHRNKVEECLELRDYMYFAEDAPEYYRLLSIIVQRLGAEVSGLFIQHWQKNGCTLAELRRMEGRTRLANDRSWEDTLATYSGYVNLLFGRRFKTIDLGAVAGHQEDILTYAITHNKKGFIRLVDEHGDLFSRVFPGSILCEKKLYQKHFNLNELTEKDLADCCWMMGKKLPKRLFMGERRYTFAELRLLYGESEACAILYSYLKSDDLDYRLRVMRQLLKRNVLDDISNEDELAALAARLDEKPLHSWRQEEFGHVEGLSAGDTARLLIHFDKLAHLLPGVKNRADAMLALRSLDQLERFASVDALKADLFEMDPDWLVLANGMKLTPEFKGRYRDSITEFLCRDGAGIARAYAKQLDSKQCGAFYRVVKAELMGQFAALKYFEGDLERELGCAVPPQVKTKWPQNDAAAAGNLKASERDDFFSTILLGIYPYSTCLSYDGGAYCHCLLACFDSNKKVLYAKRNGKVVGRACVRLTKCRMSGAGKKADRNKFDFVDLEDVAGSRGREHADEMVALFLERPYISGVGPKEQREIELLFIAAVRQKAENMGTMLILSPDYGCANPKGFVQTRLSVYISASKAGEQYLDSLGGQATVSDQGSYEENRFLVEQTSSAAHQNDKET